MPYIVTPHPTVDLSSLNLATWKEKVRSELDKWKADPKYIIVAPIPIMMTKVGEGDEIIVRESVVPGGPESYGLRIFSQGTPQSTLVLTDDGHPIGLIDRLEIFPISCESNAPLYARLTMPVGTLDIRAARAPEAEDDVKHLMETLTRHGYDTKLYAGVDHFLSELKARLRPEYKALYPEKPLTPPEGPVPSAPAA